ncbi:MAG: hypothetical protein ACFFFH_13515 [Candidatus Thorarchaeota archaeon]
MSSTNEQVKPKLKNIAIRGINANLYELFSRKIQAIGMQMGDAFNKMIEAVLESFDENFPNIDASILHSTEFLPTLSINNKETLTICKSDLIEAEARLSICGIRTLRFEEDITKEDIKSYIISISNCERIQIPKQLPKLVVLSKIAEEINLEYY